MKNKKKIRSIELLFVNASRRFKKKLPLITKAKRLKKHPTRKKTNYRP